MADKQFMSYLNTLFKCTLHRLINNENPARSKRNGFGWDSYHTLDEMYDWIDGLVEKHGEILSVEQVGDSYEGREVRAVKLSHKAGNPGIFLESNIHAREWITSATATWILNELLTSTAPEVQELAQNYDWYILPVVNPDGLNYTKETNRMWRKTRYPHSVLCYGADMNRNFPYHWMGNTSSIQYNQFTTNFSCRWWCIFQSLYGNICWTRACFWNWNQKFDGVLFKD